MTETKTYSVNITSSFNQEELSKGLWIALINASRVPPHIGMIFNGKYNSLKIAGQELDINVLALVKRVELLKIKTIFIKLKPHPVFSIDYLHEHFKIQVQKFPNVSLGGATCFTPVRTFFVENYALHENQLEYIFYLFPELYEENVITKVFTLNMEKHEENLFHLPVYSMSDIENKLNNIQ